MLQYRRVLTLLCAAVFVMPCFGQTQASFQTQTQQISPAGNTEGEPTYAVDLNNDGIPDLIQPMQEPNSSGSVNYFFQPYIANGDGTFTQGTPFTSPGCVDGTAVGDFNGDGKADIVVPLLQSNQIAVLLGNGDGTFQAPKIQTVVQSGYIIAACATAASDFNRDGKLDLILSVATSVSGDTDGMLALVPGNGDGTFSAASTIASLPTHSAAQIGTGDFDGDSNADLFYSVNDNCTDKNCGTVVHVLYGNGAGSFDDTVALTAQSYAQIGAGDLNSDGRTDLFTVMNVYTSNTSIPQLATLYGQSDRTFALYTQNLDHSVTGDFSQLEMADFDGDTRMDLFSVSTADGDIIQARTLLATTSPGAFAEQDANITGINDFNTPVVGNFVQEPYGRPSPLFVDSNFSQNYPNQIQEIFEFRNATNGGFWGGCSFPSAGQGFDLCSPLNVAAGSPFVVDTSANSFGNLRKIEFWVDGNKIGEEYHTWGQRAWAYFSNTFAAGNHSGTLFAVDTDNRLQQYNFSFTVVNCTAPASPGVNVCSPANGATMTSPVQATAAATVTGTIQKMEVWVDGVKEDSTFGSNALSASIPLSAGSHQFDYYAVNTDGQKWLTTSYVTVK